MKIFAPHIPSKGGFKKSRRGVATVEFALILPVLLAVIMGIMEFGLLIRNQLIISNAVRDGVRYASLGNSSTNVIARVKNSSSGLNPALTTTQIVLTQTSDVTAATPLYTQWPTDNGAKNTVPAGNLVRITVTYRHSTITGFFPFLKNKDIIVPVTMARELN